METKESPLADKKARMRFNKAMREKGIPAKACGKCFVVKGYDAFNVDRRKKAHPEVPSCKACSAAAMRTRRNVRMEDPTAREAERIRSLAKAARDREAVNVRSRTWYRANRERRMEADRRWKAANPEAWRSITLHARQLRRARQKDATVVPFTHAEMLADWEERDLYGCAFCGGPYDDIEHLVPLSKGGEHSLDNIVPSCRDCNRGVGGKHSRLPWEWLAERFPNLAPILVPSVLPDVDTP